MLSAAKLCAAWAFGASAAAAVVVGLTKLADRREARQRAIAARACCVHVGDSKEEVARYIAHFLIEASARAIAERGCFTVALSGGSMPKMLGEALRGPAAQSAGVDFSRWKVFFADERCVPLDHDDSNYKACRAALFGALPFSPENIFAIDPKLSPAECAAAYQHSMASVLTRDGRLASSSTLDVVCLGMGPDGHTASLFPGHPLVDLNAKLDPSGKLPGSWVTSIEDSPKPPAQRVTLTLPFLNAARQVAFIATGAGKAPMVSRVWDAYSYSQAASRCPPGGEVLPCSVVRPAGADPRALHWFMDSAAAKGLPDTCGVGQEADPPPPTGAGAPGRGPALPKEEEGLPKVMFGTSILGNLYREAPYADKKAVVEQIVLSAGGGVAVFDSAGKYGAGLALEVLGRALEELNVPVDKVSISNKLAWKRIPLAAGAEPTFEPGAWVNLEHDCTQDISYQGMYDCFEEGNRLLGKYNSRIASVHDPDEYLNSARDEATLAARKRDVLGAYRALEELRAAGKVDSIGVGAKDITAINWISDHVKLDWAMFACSITPYAHGDVAKRLLQKLGRQGVAVINSAVFNGGFLIGGSHFDYREVKPATDPELFEWRENFNKVCESFGVKPAAVCVQFSFLFPEIKSVALATSRPTRVASNIELATAVIPAALWEKLEAEGLINLAAPDDEALDLMSPKLRR